MQKSPTQELIEQLKTNSNVVYRGIGQGLKDSVKFKLPANGVILDIDPNGNLTIKDSYSGLIPIIKLPYPSILLEYGIQTQKHFVHTVVAVKEFEDIICFQVFVKIPNEDEWSVLDNIGGMTKTWDDFRVFDLEGDVKSLSALQQATMKNGALSILNLLSALNCQNVAVGDEHIKIKKRFGSKKSKPKQVGEIIYKTLIIDQDAIHADSQASVVRHGTAKKQHLRRGHIRRLKNKTIWINDCVIGDKGKGVIEKDYKVI
jgi:hypothetical protein